MQEIPLHRRITWSKNFKTPFFKRFSNFCMWVTYMSQEPHQNFSLGVGLLRIFQIFAMDRSDIVTLPIFDLRQCYLSTVSDRPSQKNIQNCALMLLWGSLGPG